jgi:hypothetical protein
MSQRLRSRTETLTGSAFFLQILEVVAQRGNRALCGEVHEGGERGLAELRRVAEGHLILAEQFKRKQTRSLLRKMGLVEAGGFQKRRGQFDALGFHALNVTRIASIAQTSAKRQPRERIWRARALAILRMCSSSTK